MLAFEPQNCRTATDGAPEPLVPLPCEERVRSRRCAVLFRGDPAPWLPQAAKSGALGGGTLPHPCSPNRGKPLDAPPCREAATRRALCFGDPAFEPCFSFIHGCSRVSRPAAPSAPRPRPRSGDARRVDLRRRVVRCDWIFWKPAIEPWCFSLQVWAGRSPESSASQRLDPGSPRHRTGAVAVASPYPGAAHYASRRRLPWASFWLKTCRPDEGLGGDPSTRTPAYRRVAAGGRGARRRKDAPRTWMPGTSRFPPIGC
jgi:hypothetical protein